MKTSSILSIIVMAGFLMLGGSMATYILLKTKEVETWFGLVFGAWLYFRSIEISFESKLMREI